LPISTANAWENVGKNVGKRRGKKVGKTWEHVEKKAEHLGLEDFCSWISW
jgi:hypothetical protein